MALFYAGIGSRETPRDICLRMTCMAEQLRERGWTLRSGAAKGADAAFEAGAGTDCEIYLPWPRFNNHYSKRCYPTAQAMALASAVHPAWDRCSQGARKLHARNGHQMLGEDLMTPVRMVICWTPNASGSGGTGQALRIAVNENIPVFDLGGDLSQTLHDIREFLTSVENEK